MDASKARNSEAVVSNGSRSNFAQARYDASRRWSRLRVSSARDEILDQKASARAELYQQNIESYIGTVETPLGLAGPLRIHGRDGSADYHVPLATTEAALVASYNRGARLLTASGGCNARVVDEAVSRTPMFAFDSLVDAELFVAFIRTHRDTFDGIVEKITAHGRLVGAETIIEGNHVYLDLRYTTGDASGQNMVTFASNAILQDILQASPVIPRYWFLEANFSGDKKASARSLGGVRGKRVIADITVPCEIVEQQLHTTPQRMVDYWYAGAIGGVMSGTTGIQGHFANGLAAFYLACGQDIACVAESATGITRMELTASGDLYTSVTLPNIMVGTVGGGTGLPSAKACLDILGLAGPGNSNALAEVCAATVLAGELSIIGAFCSGDFAMAHHALSRGTALKRSKTHE
jgi:hydroxymethylglutaryl-CoA reductase (NADPH)